MYLFLIYLSIIVTPAVSIISRPESATASRRMSMIITDLNLLEILLLSWTRMFVHTVFGCLITIVHEIASLHNHLSLTCLDFVLGFVIYSSNVLRLVPLMEVIAATSLHLQGSTDSWASNTTQKLCVRWALTSGTLHSSLVIQLLLTTILLEHHFVLLLHLHLLETHLARVTTSLIILHHVNSSYIVVILINGFLSILFNHVIVN